MIMDEIITNTFINNNNMYHLFMKRTLLFVISVSVISFFLCCSSGFSAHYPHYSFNAYFSTCLFSIFTHTLERKYMFLICNGILAFLAKNSLMASSSPSPSPQNMSSSSFNDIDFQVSNTTVAVVPLVHQEEVLGHQVKIVQEEEEKEQNQGRKVNVEACILEEEEEEGIEGNDEKEEIEEDEAMMIQDDEEVAEEDTTRMGTNELEVENTDELNRKFEEFIRKMKEEIRIEAQRPLIAV